MTRRQLHAFRGQFGDASNNDGFQCLSKSLYQVHVDGSVQPLWLNNIHALANLTWSFWSHGQTADGRFLASFAKLWQPCLVFCCNELPLASRLNKCWQNCLFAADPNSSSPSRSLWIFMQSYLSTLVVIGLRVVIDAWSPHSAIAAAQLCPAAHPLFLPDSSSSGLSRTADPMNVMPSCSPDPRDTWL